MSDNEFSEILTDSKTCKEIRDRNNAPMTLKECVEAEEPSVPKQYIVQERHINDSEWFDYSHCAAFEHWEAANEYAKSQTSCHSAHVYRVVERQIPPPATWTPRTDDEKVGHFRKELEHLLNRVSMDTRSNTPDFVLAQYMTDCLEAYDRAVNRREVWYGRKKP